LNFPGSTATLLYFTIVKCFVIVKPHKELSSFGFLHLAPASLHPINASSTGLRDICGFVCLFFLCALYFGFFLNRGKTVKYFPTKHTYVISRAVHTIELSFPLINLHLTSLPEAVSDPFVPPFKRCTLSGEHVCQSRAGHFTREVGRDVMENCAEAATG